MSKSSIASVVAGLVLAGCTVGPDYTLPRLVMPLAWGNARQADPGTPQLAEWWTRLNAPPLDALIERAIVGNPGVHAAQARVAEARAGLRQEGGATLPTLDGTGSATRSDSQITSVSNGYRVGVDASWELDLFGARRRSIEAARYGLDAAEADLRNTTLVLIGDIVLNYAELRASEARMELARRSAASVRETARLTRTRFEAGTASSADLARAEALALSTEADIPSHEITRAAALHRLGVLLGQPPTQLAGELAGSAPVPRPRFPLPVGIPAEVLLARPDVQVAERQLARATAAIGVAEAAKYPAITLIGNIDSQATNLAGLSERSTIGWSFGPQLKLPLFNGGQRQAAVEAAGARRDQAFSAYQAAVLTAMEDVENAIVALNQQRIRTGKLASAITLNREAEAAARVQFETGASSLLDLLDVQRTLYDAEAGLIESRLAMLQAWVALNKGLGGGWSGG